MCLRVCVYVCMCAYAGRQTCAYVPVSVQFDVYARAYICVRVCAYACLPPLAPNQIVKDFP